MYLTIEYPADDLMTRAIKVPKICMTIKVMLTLTNSREFSILIEGFKEWIIGQTLISKDSLT